MHSINRIKYTATMEGLSASAVGIIASYLSRRGLEIPLLRELSRLTRKEFKPFSKRCHMCQLQCYRKCSETNRRFCDTECQKRFMKKQKKTLERRKEFQYELEQLILECSSHGIFFEEALCILTLPPLDEED